MRNMHLFAYSCNKAEEIDWNASELGQFSVTILAHIQPSHLSRPSCSTEQPHTRVMADMAKEREQLKETEPALIQHIIWMRSWQPLLVLTGAVEMVWKALTSAGNNSTCALTHSRHTLQPLFLQHCSPLGITCLCWEQGSHIHRRRTKVDLNLRASAPATWDLTCPQSGGMSHWSQKNPGSQLRLSSSYP